MDADYPLNCLPINTTSNTNELITRLKCLSEALHKININDQSEPPEGYRNLCIHLIQPEFIEHSNDEVKTFVACSAAEIFRLCAPNLPFDDPEKLQDIFTLFVRVIKNLQSPNNSLFYKHLLILECLTVANSWLHVLQLSAENACVIIKNLMKTTMDIVNSKEWARNREVSEEIRFDEEEPTEKEDDKYEPKEKINNFLLSAITKLLGEADTVSFGVLDTLFFYLINPQKSNYRESYYMARSVVQAVHGNLDIPVENLLTRSLLVSGLPKDCELVGSSLKKLYDVIIELHEVAPSLVIPVIPQIGHFLKEDNEECRLSAMKAVAAIAQNPSSRLIEDYNNVWNAYVERARDTSSKIRITFAKLALNILLNSSQLRGSVCGALCRLLNDTEEEIRLEALQTTSDAAKRKLESVNEQLIQHACDRLVDSKSNIRLDAIQKLLALYGKVVSGEEYTSSDKQVVGIIADKALRLYRTLHMKEEQSKLERYLAAYLIPYKMETEKRVLHMIDLHAKLPQMAADNLRFIIMRNCSYRRVVKEILIILCKEDVHGDIKSREIEQRIERIAKEQVQSSAFYNMMRRLSNFVGDDRRAFDYLSYIVGTDTVCTKVSQTVGQFLQCVLEYKSFTKDDHVMIRHFMERLAPIIMDRDGALILVQAALKAELNMSIGKEGSELFCVRLLGLMSTWAEQLPHIFLAEDVQESLQKLAESHTPLAVCKSLDVMKHSYGIPKISIVATASYKEKRKNLFLKIALSDDLIFSKCSKRAIFTLAKLCRKEESLESFKNIWSTLSDRVDIFNPSCVNAMRAIMAIFKIFPEEFEASYERIVTDQVVTQIILSSESTADDCQEIDLCEERLSGMNIPKYTQCKMYGMKMLCRLLNGKPEHDSLADKTLKLLNAFLEYNGNIFKEDNEVTISPIEMAIIRATAGSQLIRMATQSKYQNMLTLDQYIWLSNLMTDDSRAVRKYFASKLFARFQKHALIVEYMAFYSLLPILKESDSSLNTARFIEEQHMIFKQTLINRLQMLRLKNIKPQNLPFWQPEYVFAYACFLLAVHPICESHMDIHNMELLRECLWFLMEPFCQNKGFVDFELMNKVFEQVRQNQSVFVLKAIKDKKMSNEAGENIHKKMWALADVGMCMMAYRAKLLLGGEIIDDPILNRRFFKKLAKPNSKIFAPREMITDEQKRNGKLPFERKKKTNGILSTTSRVPKKGKKDDDSIEDDEKPSLHPKRSGKRRIPVVEEIDDDSNSESEEEIMPGPSKRKLATAVTTSSKNGNSPTKSRNQKETIKDESMQSPKKRGVPVSLRNKKRGESGDELTFEELTFSPILKNTPSSKHAAGVKRGFISSTPLPTTRARNAKLQVVQKDDPINSKKKVTSSPVKRKSQKSNNDTIKGRNASGSPEKRKSIQVKLNTAGNRSRQTSDSSKDISVPTTRQTRSTSSKRK